MTEGTGDLTGRAHGSDLYAPYYFLFQKSKIILENTSILIRRGNTSRHVKEVNPHLFQTEYARLAKMETSFQSFYSCKMRLFLQG
jgi:uncharacterized protein YbcV (DUF1398 family)